MIVAPVTLKMNSLKKELKTVIKNQKNFNDEISGMKARIEALENKKDIINKCRLTICWKAYNFRNILSKAT